jgi:hypothetical protein
MVTQLLPALRDRKGQPVQDADIHSHALASAPLSQALWSPGKEGLQELGIDRFVDEPPRACTNAVIAALVFGPISPSMSCSPPIWAE